MWFLHFRWIRVIFIEEVKYILEKNSFDFERRCFNSTASLVCIFGFVIWLDCLVMLWVKAETCLYLQSYLSVFPMPVLQSLPIPCTINVRDFMHPSLHKSGMQLSQPVCFPMLQRVYSQTSFIQATLSKDVTPQSTLSAAGAFTPRYQRSLAVYGRKYFKLYERKFHYKNTNYSILKVQFLNTLHFCNFIKLFISEFQLHFQWSRG